MSSPHDTDRPARSGLRGRLGETGWTRVRAVAATGMVFGLGAVGTMAAWSDTATATSGMFSTSDVNIQIKLDNHRPVHNFTGLSKINLARGASTAAMLPVNNTGSADFDYAATALVANDGTATYGGANAQTFGENLTMKAFRGGSSNGTTCSGGSEIGSTTLGLGDHDLVPSSALSKDSTDDLCFQVTVNANAPLAARMSALAIDLKFTATQS